MRGVVRKRRSSATGRRRQREGESVVETLQCRRPHLLKAKGDEGDEGRLCKPGNGVFLEGTRH